MERFEMNLQNPVVRIWFYTVFPTLLGLILLLILLPYEYRNIIIMVNAFINVAFWLWYLLYKKKKSIH